MTTIRIIDLETQSHEHLGRKGSPYCDKNYIVMPGWRDDVGGQPGAVQDLYFKSRAEAEDPAKPWFNLDGVDLLVAHNAMFEMSWFFTRHREEFLKFLRRGGRVLCTQLAEYLLSHQTWTYPALDEVAPKHGGTHKVDGIKALWDQGVLTSEMDPALLREYLSGPCGDVNNTALVFYSQMQMLQAKGMWRMYLERCEGMLAFSICEVSGLKIDREVADKNHAVQLAELAGIREELVKLVPTDLPETLEFNWGSDYHMSALLFGGEVRYRKRVPYDPPKMEKADFIRFGTVQRGATVEEQTTRMLAEDLYTDGALDFQKVAAWQVEHGTVVTYASGKQKGQVKEFREDTDVPAMKWDEDGRYKFPGIIKFTDMPDVLRDKYTGKRAEFQQARSLPDGTPVYSTSGDSLKALETFGFQQAALLMRAATLEKDNGAFYITHEYNKDGTIKKSKGMLQYVGEDGIIHHSLNQCATGTTRLSSSSPNLQQLPKVDEDNPMAGSRVKEMFVSRFGADGSIGEVDYTALEVVWCAALSGDMNLLEKLLSGTDMHLYRLAGAKDNWNGFTYDELMRIKKDDTHEWHGRMMKARSAIKPKAFSAQYGAQAMGIAFNTGCTVEEAQAFLDNEAALFPQSIAFRQTIRDAVELTGSTMDGLCREQTEFGWTVYRRGYYQAPGGTCYSFRQYPKWDRETRQTIMDYKDTQIANYWNQGEAGFMMTVSMGRIARWMIARPQFMVTEFLINNVHDAVYTDCRNDTQREVNLACKAILEDAPKYMSEQLGYSIGHIPFPAVAESGSSMFNKKHLH